MQVELKQSFPWAVSWSHSLQQRFIQHHQTHDIHGEDLMDAVWWGVTMYMWKKYDKALRNRVELLKMKAVDETMTWDLAIKEVFELFTG